MLSLLILVSMISFLGDSIQIKAQTSNFSMSSYLTKIKGVLVFNSKGVVYSEAVAVKNKLTAQDKTGLSTYASRVNTSIKNKQSKMLYDAKTKVYDVVPYNYVATKSNMSNFSPKIEESISNTEINTNTMQNMGVYAIPGYSEFKFLTGDNNTYGTLIVTAQGVQDLITIVQLGFAITAFVAAVSTIILGPAAPLVLAFIVPVAGLTVAFLEASRRTWQGKGVRLSIIKRGDDGKMLPVPYIYVNYYW